MAISRRPAISTEDLRTLLRRAVSGAADGLTPTALRKALPLAYRPPQKQWKAVLAEAVRAGALHRWPIGRGGRYAARPHEDALREKVLAALADGPRSEPELKKELPSAAHDRLAGLLGRWAAQGGVYAHGKQGRSRVWGTRPAEDLDYVLRPALLGLLAQMAARGFAEAAVRAALSRQLGGRPAHDVNRPDPATLIARLRELNPQVDGGALVYLPHLRTAMRDVLPDKPGFDRLVLSMLEQRRVQLQSHPVPSQLKPEERESMIEDGRGSYYMAIGLRQG